MYDKASECETVNDARMVLFTRKGGTNDNIPPTEAALLQHTNRACFMASQIWDRCLEPTSSPTDPRTCGGKGIKQICGFYFGQYCLKRKRPAVSLLNVDASLRMDVEGEPVQLFVNVVENVTESRLFCQYLNLIKMSKVFDFPFFSILRSLVFFWLLFAHGKRGRRHYFRGKYAKRIIY
jgi:hypothetical protein